MSSPLRPKNYRQKIYLKTLRTQLDGNNKLLYGLTQIRGIGKRFAQAIILSTGLNQEMRIGELPERDLKIIEEILINPEGKIPPYFFNRRKDLRSGDDLHIIGNKLEINLKRDIDRMKRIKSYKGVRHHLHLKVRGQRTKSTGRHGLVIGVMRRRRRDQ